MSKYIVMSDFYESPYNMGDILEIVEKDNTVSIPLRGLKYSKKQWNITKDMLDIEPVTNATIHLVQKRLTARIELLNKLKVD